MKIFKPWFYIFCVMSLAVACTSKDDSGGSSPPQAASSAAAGPDQTVTSGTKVTLDGSGSKAADASTTITDYLWTQISGTPTVSLDGADQVSASFTAPTVTAVTQLVFQLTITDSKNKKYSDNVVVTVNPPLADNLPPVAKATVSSSTVVSGSNVELDGSASNDPDGNITKYSWVQTTNVAGINLNGANQSKASFVAPTVTANTLLTFELTVTDNRNASNSASVSVTVTPPVTNGSAYVPVQSFDLNSGTYKIDVIDNNNPSAGLTNIESGGVDVVMPYDRVDYDSNTQEILNGHVAYLLYVKGKKVWRLALEPGTNLQPQQVSNASYDLCGDVNAAEDSVDLLKSILVLETAGNDLDCNTPADNKIYLVQLGMSSSDAPLDATGKIYSPATLGVDDTGLYTVTNGQMFYYSLDLSTSTNLNLAVANPDSVQFLASSGSYQIAIVDSQLISFNSNVSHSASVWDASVLPSNLNCDSSYCFFAADIGDGTYSIHKFPVNGSAVAQELAASNVAYLPYELETTANYLFYRVLDLTTGTFTLYRFPKTPANTDKLDVVDSGLAGFPFIFTSPAGLFYDFQTTDGAGSITGSRVVFSDESLVNKQVFDNAKLVGVQIDRRSMVTGAVKGKMYYASGATDFSAGFGGATIKSLSLLDGSAQPDVGVIADGSPILGLFFVVNSYYGANRIYSTAELASSASISGYQSDIFLLQPNSTPLLTNLSNTPADSELLLFY